MHNFAQPTEDSGKSQKRHLEIWELTMGLVRVEGLPRLFGDFFSVILESPGIDLCVQRIRQNKLTIRSYQVNLKKVN